MDPMAAPLVLVACHSPFPLPDLAPFLVRSGVLVQQSRTLDETLDRLRALEPEAVVLQPLPGALRSLEIESLLERLPLPRPWVLLIDERDGPPAEGLAVDAVVSWQAGAEALAGALLERLHARAPRSGRVLLRRPQRKASISAVR